MKTFADLKRRMRVGVTVVLVWSKLMPHKFLGVERKVVKVQRNGVWFEIPGEERNSWLAWSRASEFQISDNGFSILEDGVAQLTYEVRP